MDNKDKNNPTNTSREPDSHAPQSPPTLSTLPELDPQVGVALPPYWKNLFLVALFESWGNISLAARSINISRQAVYNAIKNDPPFADKVYHIREGHVDKIEEIAFERAAAGSDTLIKFILEGKRPEVYGPKKSNEDNIPINVHIYLPDNNREDQPAISDNTSPISGVLEGEVLP
jgi:hypothetical protein